MSAHPKSRGPLIANVENVASTIRVRCPGRAHDRGEACIICDEGAEGSISVVVTDLELVALRAAAQGRLVEPGLTPRLRVLGLLHEVAGYTVPTEEGFALLGTFALCRN